MTGRDALKPISGVEISHGLLVVEPDQFGLSGSVRRQFANDDLHDLAESLEQIVKVYPRAEKTHNSHVRLGIQLGIEWESAIPETDPQSIRARQRARGDR